MRSAALLVLAAATAVALGACSAPDAGTRHPVVTPNAPPSVTSNATSTPSPSADPLVSASPTATVTATTPPVSTAAPTGLPDGLSLAQCVGQLFMVGSPATAAAPGTLGDVANLGVGGVFLSGRSTAGAATTAAVAAQFEESDHVGLPLLIATDQEGGEVQVLRGAGFSDLPSALAQAALSPATLTTDAETWGRQLRAAGLDMDLAPVSDVVASAQQAAVNPPIGQLDREYGYGAATTLPHAQAFERGMLDAGVIPVAKHFPGLGAVTANTDFSSDVTDVTTGDSSPSVAVFGALISGGAPVVMVSSAIYARIAPGVPAVFSPAVVTGLLRQRLGFTGVVISDDLSAAAQVEIWSPGDRAIFAIEAGVDVVLVSAAPQLAPEMAEAVLGRAQTDPPFTSQVEAACTRVVQLKARYLPSR